MPTIASPDLRASTPRRNVGGRVTISSSRAELDRLLFEPSGWFALGADNHRLPALVVATLADGLARVGRGEVATIVGQLKSGFLVVDVDVDEEVRGGAITDLVTRWASREQLWALVRPSGGAAGRHHVFVATGDARTVERLKVEVAALRAGFNLSPRALDVRRAVRPLSAPHRSGAWTAPYGSLTASVQNLSRGGYRRAAPEPTHIGQASGHRGRRTTASVAEVAAAGELRDASGALYGPIAQRYLTSGKLRGQHRGPSPGRALTPWQPRARRDLPAEWATYLATGTVPPLGGHDRSRTTVEARLTSELLRAGHDATSAWELITTADPGAMTRSRVDHRRWIRWVWNRAVWDDHDFHGGIGRPAPSSVPCPGEVLAAIDAAREALTATAGALPARRRAAVLLVGHTVLDRMQRRHALRTPVPERDLHVDTGLDRGTIRTVLRLLDGPLGRLHRDTLSRSPTARASTSFEFEIPPPPVAVSLIPPPSSHTPAGQPPHPALWATLPAPSHPLWRHLIRQPEPLTLRQLTQATLLPSPGTVALSVSQLRTARTGLRALAAAGLAECAPDGRWTALEGRVSSRVLHVARVQRAERNDRVAQERAAYRRGTHTSWVTWRATALSCNYFRERAWWAGLPAVERRARTRHWSCTYEGFSVVEQARVKTLLAQRRGRAGIDEVQRHAAWIAGHPPEEYARRSVAKTHWFRALPKPLQQAYTAAWRHHRERFNIPIGLPRSLAELHASTLPDTRAVHDRQHLQATIPGLPAAVTGRGHTASG